MLLLSVRWRIARKDDSRRIVWSAGLRGGRGSGGFALILRGTPVPGKQFMKTVLGNVGDARERRQARPADRCR